MDRNANPGSTTLTFPGSLSARRAWIEIPAGCWRDSRRASLSARRAWIEISKADQLIKSSIVALRKESVDRNKLQRSIDTMSQPSLSARRAWIEIVVRYKPTPAPVSLSARRAWIEMPVRC